MDTRKIGQHEGLERCPKCGRIYCSHNQRCVTCEGTGRIVRATWVHSMECRECGGTGTAKQS